jgi:hypothetical protein
MDNVIEIIRDQAWQFIGAVIGLFALIVSIAIYFFGRKRKHLSYSIIASEPLLTVDEALSGEIKVSFNDELVQDVHLLIIKVTNSGNIAIEESDFKLSLAFGFGDAKILSYEVIESPPQGLHAKLRKSGGDRGIVLNPLLLNASDSVVLKFLLSGYNNELTPSGRIKDVKRIDKVNRSRIATDPLSMRGLFFLVIFIILNILFYTLLQLPSFPTFGRVGTIILDAIGIWFAVSISLIIGTFLLDIAPKIRDFVINKT